MDGMLRTLPSNAFSPCRRTSRRREFHMDAPLHLRLGPNLCLRKSGLPFISLWRDSSSLSRLICGESHKLFLGFRILNANEHLVGGKCSPVSSVEVTGSSLSTSETCLDSRNAASCSSLENIALTKFKVLCWSLLENRPEFFHLFSSPSLWSWKIIEQNRLAHLATSCGRVLLLGLIFVTLGFSPSRVSSRRALAAPATRSADLKGKLDVQEQENIEKDRQFISEGREDYGEFEQESQRRRKRFERKSREEVINERLTGLTDILADPKKIDEKERDILKKLFEGVPVAGVKERVLTTSTIKAVDAYLKVLVQEGELIRKQLDRAIDDYLSAKEVVDSSGPDVTTAVKEANERTLMDTEDVLVNYRRRLLDIEVAVRKISQLMKQRTATNEAGVEHSRSSRLFKIARDLDQLKSTEREQHLLPLAANIEKEEINEGARSEVTAAILQRIEQEKNISKKLENLLGKLVNNLDSGKSEVDPELEENLSEARDMIFDESRWQDGDEETNNDTESPQIYPHLRRRRGRRDAKAAFTFPESSDQKDISAEEKEEVLVARDMVLNGTWYDEKMKRWEMKPEAALGAVQKNIAGYARVRHDRRAMYLTLKGDEREYFVNAKKFDAEYEKYGGFHTLLLKLIASGVPTSNEVMQIPLHERETEFLLQLPFKIIGWLFQDIWNSNLVVSVRPWYYKNLVEAFEEVIIRFGFPTVQRIVPENLRVALGFDLPEGAEAAEPTDIIIWQQEAQKHVDARYAEGSGSLPWWISLPARCYMFGLPLLILVRFVVQVVVAPFQPEPLAMNVVQWKEKMQEDFEKELEPQTKKEMVDPIKSVFDKMKRVKSPAVSLKDFAGIDMIKEEINEIISFLKNPKLFKEMGARPPRGVLIVGDSGTGKTTLALAIAAEARVPMVQLQGSELEGGAWVGQGASNVRELFKTAREVAPLIIFMDDFDHFAGVRGATSDTRKQDHESLINQLLVELDGFETQEGVVLVATTSRPYAIDEALRRPGRMDRTIKLPMPNKHEREQILRLAAHQTMDAHLIPYVDWTKVAEKTAGLTPARLKYVPEGLEGIAVSNKIVDEDELMSIFGWLATINRMSPSWIKESNWTKWYNDRLVDFLGLRVTKEDMESAVEYLDVFGESKPGIEFYDPPYNWTRDFKFPHAVWAVGKGLVALLLPDFDLVDQIWLDPTSWEGIGFVKFSKKLEGGYEETGTITRSHYEKELVSCFGSFVASRMLLRFGENNNLCKFEIENAQEVATRMVMEYGWAPDGSPMIYMTDGSEFSLAMGNQHERTVAEYINQLFYRACNKATQMLEQNRLVLDAMVEQLLESDGLNNEDMRKILEDKGAVFEQEPFSLVPFSHTEIVDVSTNGSGRLGKAPSLSVTT